MVVAVFSVVAVTRQLQALESFFGLFEQYVAKAGRPVVAVCDPVVYVAQKGAGRNCEDRGPSIARRIVACEDQGSKGDESKK